MNMYTKKNLSLAGFALTVLLTTGSAALASEGKTTPALTPQQSFEALVAGNARFVSEGATHLRQDKARRTETAAGQHPAALVLACSDSRVPVETLFDQGIGDIFVVRIPGNTAPAPILAALEYAVDHLHVPLVVVLGHTHCGAVKLACSTGTGSEGELTGFQPHMVESMLPLVAAAQKAGIANADDLQRHVTSSNVRTTIQTALEALPALRESVRTGKVMVAGGIYAVNDGTVEWLETKAP